MSAFFKAELKDKFLQYASEREDYFEVQLLYDEFLRPNYSLEYVEKLIREIVDHNPELLDIMSGNGVKIFMLSATPVTYDFLEEGGFKELFVQEEEKWDMLIEQMSNSRKLSAQEKANLGSTEKKAYKRERSLLYFLISAVTLSFIFTLYSLLRPFFVKTNEKRIESIEQRLQQLEKENALLKEELDSIEYLYKKNSQ